MAEVKVQVRAETKSAEDALRKAQQLADSLGKKQATIRIKAEGLDGLAKQIRVVENETAKLSMSADTFRALSSGAITATQAMEDMGAKVNRVNTDMQSFIDHATGVSRETSQITAKTSMFGKVSDDTFKSYTSGAMSGESATKTLQKGMSGLGAETQKTSGIFDSLIKRFTAANLASTAITFAISKIRQALREAVSEMKEMDKELTTIKMVSGASDYEIGQLRDQAFAGARANGRSVTDYLSAAEMFTRAGYRENIDQLSKLSLITQNVGGVEEEVAGKFLLAADAAWKLGGSYESLMGVLDGVSSVADQNATDLGKIAEGITIAGSAMANAGVSAKEFTAMLGVTTATTQRSGSEMARGLRTILYRVRQVKAEFEDGEMVNSEDISNAAKALKEIADIDVLDSEGHLKGFSQIMNELAEKWPTISKYPEAVSKLQEALAGNRQGNVLISWMQNWDKYEQMLSQYDESAGTALQKNAEYTDSWAAATNNLSTAWTNLVGAITSDGGILKEIVEGLGSSIDTIATKIRELQNDESLWSYIKLRLGDKFWDTYDYGRAPDGSLRLRRKDIIEEDEKALEEAQRKTAQEAYERGYMWSGYAQSVKEAEQAAKKAKEETNALTDAFEKQRNKIADVAKAIKEEKDDAVNSLSDIYKAMNEAAENGYYGSNAFTQGGALFFSQEVLDDIRNGRNNPLKDAMDAYIEGIQEGDYSGAAAELFSSITKGANEIKDANGEVLASVTDVGDAFQWSFDKGGRSMDEYLSELSGSTGISQEFWASMIESLGMYTKDLDDWSKKTSEVKEESPIETEYVAKTEEANQKTDELQENYAETPKTVETVFTTRYETIGAPPAGATPASNPTWSTSGKWNPSPSGGTKVAQTKAGGKRDNYSGIALVNDEYPANGSKPELIISPSKGTAYIANRGKPALVNLASDDVVLTASETRSALGVPMFPGGKEGSSITITTPKSSNSSSTTKSSKKKTAAEEATDPTENWNQLKKLIDYAIDKEKDVLDDKLAILDKQLAELESARKSQKNIDALAQKLVNVDEAQLDLLKAQTERTVRYYNESTKQWEWMADQGALAEAENAYETALKDLNDFLADLNFEEQKANIKAQKDALQEAFDTYKKGWDLIVESIEAPTGDLAALFAELKTNGTEAMKSQAENIQSLLGALEEGFYTSIDDAALANAESLAKTYEMLNASSSDSQARAQEAINNILGRSQQASTETTDAAKLALGDLSSVGSKSITDLMGEAQKSLDSMTTETESTGEGMAKTLSDAAVDIAGTASGAILDIVQNANDFLNRVKEAETAKKEAESGKSGSGSGGGSGKSSKGGKGVIGETTKKTADVLGATALKTAYSKASAAAEAEVKKYTSDLVKNSFSKVVNNNGGNTYINGVKIGSNQINRPLGSVLSNLNIHTNSDR